MITFFSQFTNSDWLEFIGIIVSLITSFVAIYISVKTLKQNSQMIEESTRPYVVICGKTANFQDPRFYLVLKNYGTSGATITKFNFDQDLSKFSYRSDHTPYQNICGTFIAPNQSFICNLMVNKLFENPNIILTFQIEYSTPFKNYKESFKIPLSSYTDLIQTRAATKDKELRNISYTLQDLVEKNL